MSETAQTFESVWDALADTPEEAANLRARSDLMDAIADIIAAKGWTQAEAVVETHLCLQQTCQERS